jgi:hypothetical protein
MRKRTWIAAVMSCAAVAAGVSVYSKSGSGKAPGVSGAMAFRIVMGEDDKQPSNWDGSISVSPGRIVNIEGWRFSGEDSTDSRSSWKLSTRRIEAKYPAERKQALPVVDNGVIVKASEEDSAAQFDVKTKQGDFSFRAGDIPFGPGKRFLNGRVVVDRVPCTEQITSSEQEQDFPAMAQSGDSVYVSYVEFVHRDPSLEARDEMKKEPKSFDYLSRPAGGDQVFLLTYSKSKRTWSEPVAVSAPKQDVMRTAVAVDGKNRVWVFWSANQDGNFDIYGKSLTAGKWSAEMRLTKDPGTDLNPVAATDAKGRVWVAWQGLRNDNLEILAAAQDGDKFSKEKIVSFSPASDWDPSIAAAPNGEVAVSWDTYDKGDYDVYFRHLKMDGGMQMDSPVPVAASRNFEARSSIAYDSQNRLWVAYEASTALWGKDFGALEKTGVSLYHDHTVQVKCFQGSRAFATESKLSRVLPAIAPYPGVIKGGANPMPPAPLNSFPRLAADPNGMVYLAFRTPVAGRSPVGGLWFTEIVYFDGADWKGPVLVPHTEYWVDARTALAAIAPGKLMAIAPGDHRMSATTGKGVTRFSTVLNSDLYAAEMRIGEAPRAVGLASIPDEKVADPDPDSVDERAHVKTMRDYRTTLGTERLQLLRGEFHRHTEMSADGGNDGPLIDAYRYFIDAASMDWGGCCDHDNGEGREYSWWLQQKLTDAYHLGTNFVPMFSYERTVQYPEGHRNVVFVQRGVRTLPRLPKTDANSAPTPAPDTQMLYRYLRRFDGIVASHTSATDQGTDWRDNDPILEPIVEIYQGDRQSYEMPGAPRSNSEKHSISGYRPLGYVSLALKKGYRLGFQASSDHVSTHMSYCNLFVASSTREAIMEAFHKRRIYGSTDDILADVRCGAHLMGEEFETPEPPAISVKLWGREKFSKVQIIRNGEYVYSASPETKNVDFVWKDNAPEKGKTSYYYVRGEQADGELVWVSPMWITYR